MALAIVLNIVFATFGVAVIVGGLAWSIALHRRHELREVALARQSPPTATTERTGATRRRALEAYATA